MKTKTGNFIILTTHDPLQPVQGGGALRTLAVARQLLKKDFEVVLIAPQEIQGQDTGGLLRLSLPGPRKQCCQLLSTVKFNFRLLRLSLPLLKKTDILLTHNTIAAILVPFLKKIHKFDFVLDITDIHAAYLPAGKSNFIEALLTPLLLRYEYLIIKNARRLTVATRAMKEHLEQKGVDPAKMLVVYDSVEKKEIPAQKDPGAEWGIIHLGAIDRQHNVEVLIRAVPRVVSRFPQARFFIVGAGREKENLEKLAVKLGVSNNCVFTGPLGHEQAREYLRSASIGIISRQDCLANRIVTTQKLFEYWASFTAVISTRLAGISEIAGSGKDILWFDSGEVSDLAEKINLLLADQQYRQRLAEAGYLRADEFDRGRCAEKIVDFLTGP